MKGLPKEWLLEGLEQSAQTLAHILADVSQARASAIRDGDDGWSVLEIMCHLRDYQAIFAERIRRILEEEDPTFQLYDEEARLRMVVENEYANQNLRAVLEDYLSTRRAIIERLTPLDDAQWKREGRFAADDIVDLTMPVVHTLLHDADHKEQIARILRG
ncbi:MAG: DinB family protein [Chloroflexi bacterium]|nr:DinB family protein [Chloroflexota bacterium]